MMVKVGDSCTLSGRYSGKPAPSVTWTKNEEELKPDEDLAVRSSARHLSLDFIKARRDHTGRYRVSVDNPAGTRTGICALTVVGESADRMGPCGKVVLALLILRNILLTLTCQNHTRT